MSDMAFMRPDADKLVGRWLSSSLVPFSKSINGLYCGDTSVPFYRKVLAQNQPEDPGGYGPNWSNVDDYDIPTVLRKQMD